MTSSVGYNSQPLTLFCDFDGPIVDVSDRYYSTYKLGLANIQELYQASGQSLRIQPLSKRQFWQMKQERVCDQEIAMRSGLRGEAIPTFLKLVREIVNQPTLLHKDRMQSGVNWALALLHSQGVHLYVVSLRHNEQIKQILQNYGLLRLFSGIYGTGDKHLAYLNYSDIKRQLLEQAIAEHSTEKAYMVGDTEADILAAQSLGISSIALTCGIRSRSYLLQFQPDQIYTDLLCSAHHVLNLALSPTNSSCS